MNGASPFHSQPWSREGKLTQDYGLDPELRVKSGMIDRFIFFLHVASLAIFGLQININTTKLSPCTNVWVLNTASGIVSDLSTQAKCAVYSYTYLFIDWI